MLQKLLMLKKSFKRGKSVDGLHSGIKLTLNIPSLHKRWFLLSNIALTRMSFYDCLHQYTNSTLHYSVKILKSNQILQQWNEIAQSVCLNRDAIKWEGSIKSYLFYSNPTTFTILIKIIFVCVTRLSDGVENYYGWLPSRANIVIAIADVEWGYFFILNEAI